MTLGLFGRRRLWQGTCKRTHGGKEEEWNLHFVL